MIKVKGVLLELCAENSYSIVDTRNDQYKRIRLYYDKSKVKLVEGMTVEFDLCTSALGNSYGKLVSVVERNDTLFNTEDRSKWYDWGQDEEADFIKKIVPQLKIDIRINPEKEKYEWAIDLYDYTNRRYADLKTQNTPFFTVGKYNYGRVKCDPAYSVTFNRKDYLHYKEKYPGCDIYFWVHWLQTQYRSYSVPEIYGVWRAPFQRMQITIESGIAPLHAYQNRVNDDHNAKDSYVFNLLDTNVFERLI